MPAPAAALGLTVWWGLILLQVLLARRGRIEPAALVLTLVAAFSLLSRRRPIRPTLLRALEFAIFALIVWVLAVLLYRSMWDVIIWEDEFLFYIALKNALISSMTLMLAYATLIPNSWRAAAPVVIGIAAYAAVTVWCCPGCIPRSSGS